MGKLFAVFLALAALTGVTLSCLAQQRGFLGVDMRNVSDERAGELRLPDTAGALIVNVRPGSPAEKAGLRADDVILALDDMPIKNMDAVVGYVGALSPGTTLKIAIWRDGNRREELAKLSPFPTALGDPAPR